jgi:glycosyltransferase involved in cell wall biosynthesis
MMDDDGANVEQMGYLNINSALHPTILKDGRVMFTSYESQGLRDLRLWAVWTIWPDGSHWEPLVSAFGPSGDTAFHFMSQLSYPELAACYSECEIFALPSGGEGFGLVYLEAMARGKPVIGGAHGGVPEVIEDGKTGFLVQHGDVPQLATSIETLLADPALGREMGARGRERVARDFRFNTFAKSLKKILRELCES